MTSTPVRPPVGGPDDDFGLSAELAAVEADLGERPAGEPSRAERSEVTRRLLDRAVDEPEARRKQTLDEVVVLNMRVADAVANRFARRGVAIEDLRQVAYIALVRAVREYDPRRGGDLLGYAVPCMEGEIRRYFRDHGWTIRPPREVQRAHARIVHSGRVVERVDDAELADLAAELDESTAAVREALVARDTLSMVSLDAPGGLVDRAPVTDDDQRQVEARLLLRPVLAQLTEPERRVLHWRFVEELSQRDIAERMGASQVQVCRLLQKLLGSLRVALAA